MANRSYIYGLKGSRHISLGEEPNAIPFAFRILAAYDNAAAESHLFDPNVAITADFAKGKAALYRLLDLLSATNEMQDQAGFEQAVAQTKTFLDAADADRVLLENGEIYALRTREDGSYLNAADMEKANEYAREDYQWIGEDIDNLFETGVQPHQLFHITDETMVQLFGWVMELRTHWKERLGLDCWRSILYFQFSEH